MMILFVNFQVLGEGGNTVGQQADLNFRRSGVCFVKLKFVNQFLFFFCVENHCYSLLFGLLALMVLL
jgi:hypothetical protein